MGLHGRQHAQHHRALARDPRQRVRRPRRHEPRRPPGQGRRPALRARRRRRSSRRAAPTAARPARATCSRARSPGTMTVPCYLDKKGCPVGSRFRYEKLKKTANFQANRFVYVPERIKNNTMQVPFTLHRPARRAQQALAPRALRARAVRRPGRRAAPRRAGSSRRRATSRSAPRARPATRARTRRLLHAAFADASRFAQVADRLQQGAVNSLMLGRLMIHPKGLVTQAAVPRAVRRPGDRHLRRLLRQRRRRPVRRHGHRALAGLRARVARHAAA